MAKGYIVAQIDVTGQETYCRYTDATPAAAAAFGGRFLVRGGRHEQLEGEGRARQVVIEFPDYASARAFYDSEAYRAVLPHALDGSRRELLVVEGVEEE
jgi:uncharacterized protein (DUF1330 family)